MKSVLPCCSDVDLIAQYKGEHIAVREIRKHIGWYIKGMHGAAAMRRRTNTINDPEEMRTVIRSMIRTAV